MKIVVTDDKAIEAYKMYHDQNKSVETIAKHFGVSGKSIYNWLTKVEEKGLNKKKKQLALPLDKSTELTRGEKRKIIEKWLNEHPNGLFNQFIKDTGLSIHSSYFYNLRAIHNAAHGQNDTPKNGSNSKSSSKDAQSIETIQKLLDENEFLKWWNEGERKGYVEKLLHQMNNLDTTS